jgi:hypothetical protein
MYYYCDSLICPLFSGALYGMNVHMLVEFKSLPVAFETRLRRHECHSAFERAQTTTTTHRRKDMDWSPTDSIHETRTHVHRRTPVVIFLSDEEGHVRDVAIFHICRDAVYQRFVNLHPD